MLRVSVPVWSHLIYHVVIIIKNIIWGYFCTRLPRCCWQRCTCKCADECRDGKRVFCRWGRITKPWWSWHVRIFMTLSTAAV